MFQAAQQRANLLEDEIEKLKRNEKRNCVVDQDGTMRQTVDVGGRKACAKIFAELQTVLQKLGPAAQQRFEAAAMAAEHKKESTLEALAVPLNAPLSL